ncbi:hypothetical protein ACROSR_18415 [Roseovarius tibetensis]|uniref:hypothetical protein n=1 Tax=Roseovarius tibetensis TaxID=2685897 RepID=UPI003D7F4487
MHNIDRIRLSNHPDPRMRAAAADAARLRSELWGLVLSRAFRAVLSAMKLSFRAATGRLGLSPGCREGRMAADDLSVTPRTPGCSA